MDLETELSKESLYPKYYGENLSPNDIARDLKRKGMKVSSEKVRLKLVEYGYKPRSKSEAISIALLKKYGSAN